MISDLDHAQAILDGRLQVRGHSARTAGWLARSELERRLRALLIAKGVEPGRASGRSVLSCVESVYADDHPQLAADAEYAWQRLSSACHQHAYELAPTRAEIAGLLDLVRTIGVTPT